jgi:hypothetical protein
VPSPQAVYVAATIVAMLQFLRVRERRLLPLVLGFALLAVAHHQEDWYAARAWHLGAGLALLVALVALTPKSSAR